MRQVEQPGQGQGEQAPERATLRSAIAEIVARLDVPFGFTLSIWSAGQAVTHSYGFPTYADVFLFVAGAGVGYLLMAYTFALGLSGRGRQTRNAQLAVVDVVATLIAVSVGYLAEGIGSEPAGYFVVPLAVVAVYLLGLGVLEYLAIRLGFSPRS